MASDAGRRRIIRANAAPDKSRHAGCRCPMLRNHVCRRRGRVKGATVRLGGAAVRAINYLLLEIADDQVHRTLCHYVHLRLVEAALSHLTIVRRSREVGDTYPRHQHDHCEDDQEARRPAYPENVLREGDAS